MYHTFTIQFQPGKNLFYETEIIFRHRSDSLVPRHLFYCFSITSTIPYLPLHSPLRSSNRHLQRLYFPDRCNLFSDNCAETSADSETQKRSARQKDTVVIPFLPLRKSALLFLPRQDREARPSAAASGTHADCAPFPRKGALPLAGNRPVRASLPEEKANPTRKASGVSLVETGRLARRLPPPARTRTVRPFPERAPFPLRGTVLFEPPFRKKKQTPPAKRVGFLWWRQGGSNSRPHGCEPCALTN